ncbi:hypothetical protein [uncultured Methanobacterium sp.]|uniref:hypothetical protein n=1 Tax=uncultured Methanobacterium sp. TaxID=176306 RepID=UPI002AA9484B|nr:hypothetical protein [uncultured Methanobacterium sp.]
MKLDTPPKRILTGIILIIALAGLCTYYVSEYPNHLEYPSYEVILTDYPIGEVVNIGGTVTSTFNGGFQTTENFYGHWVNMKIISDTPVSVDDKVSLVGVLAPNNTIINVERIEVNKYWKYIFVLLRSLVALIFLIYIFHRYWSFDWKSYEFRRR